MNDEPMKYRSKDQGVETVGVSFPKRTIEVIVTPWEREAEVDDYGRGVVTEVFSRGAYDGIETRPNRIRVNRDHVRERTVGRALTFSPNRDDGLHAELKIADTLLGDETLQLAAEDCLDASAGWKPMPGGLRWEGRNRVRVTKAWLGHIALVPDPAYEGARVLAVRGDGGAVEPVLVVPATPHRDEIQAWLFEQRQLRYTRA